ncbi:MAG TPA: hypothetical protein VKZ82_25715 [Nonomuraea sp.]|nr:hypothetical protein [Nonomuraea sp.]
MLRALATTRHPQLALLGWAAIAYRLEATGVSIEMAGLPEDTLGELDEEAGVLRIRQGAPLDDQMWLMQQAWNWIAIGPHATPFARVVPRLRLVEPPRELLA